MPTFLLTVGSEVWRLRLYNSVTSCAVLFSGKNDISNNYKQCAREKIIHVDNGEHCLMYTDTMSFRGLVLEVVKWRWLRCAGRVICVVEMNRPTYTIWGGGSVWKVATLKAKKEIWRVCVCGGDRVVLLVWERGERWRWREVERVGGEIGSGSYPVTDIGISDAGS
jgi:hypothetical protein